MNSICVFRALCCHFAKMRCVRMVILFCTYSTTPYYPNWLGQWFNFRISKTSGYKGDSRNQYKISFFTFLKHLNMSLLRKFCYILATHKLLVFVALGFVDSCVISHIGGSGNFLTENCAILGDRKMGISVLVQLIRTSRK